MMSEQKMQRLLQVYMWTIGVVLAIGLPLFSWNTYTVHSLSIQIQSESSREVEVRKQVERDLARNDQDHTVMNNRISGLSIDMQELKLKIVELNLRLAQKESRQ